MCRALLVILRGGACLSQPADFLNQLAMRAQLALAEGDGLRDTASDQ